MGKKEPNPATINAYEVQVDPRVEDHLTQEFSLILKEKPPATMKLNLDTGFYLITWAAELPPTSLVDLVEECLTHYETQYPNGIEVLEGLSKTMPIDPSFGKDRKSDSAYLRGLIYSDKRDHRGSHKSEVPSCQRPLTWQQFVESVEGEEIWFLGIHTPIGEFCIHSQLKEYSFSIFSNISYPGGFIDMVEKSTNGEIPVFEALKLFQRAYSTSKDEIGQKEFYSREQPGGSNE